MKIILDFDDVLFNTRKFKDDLIAVFTKNEVSREDFLATYKDYPTVSRKGLQKYDPWKQIKILEKKLGIDGKKVSADLKKFLDGCQKYVFPDVADFLKKIPKQELFLLSYGHTGFQDEKIKKCRLAPFFKKIIVTDKLKADVAIRIAGKKEPFIFIEDRIAQINAIKKKFPESVTVLLKRKEGRYEDQATKHVDHEVKNLGEVIRLMENGKVKIENDNLK